jgi:hypothetical protein
MDSMTSPTPLLELFDVQVPERALRLLLSFEARGFCLRPDPSAFSIKIWPSHELTPDDRALGAKLKAHLYVLVTKAGPCSCPRCRSDRSQPVTEAEKAQLEARQRA